MFKLVVFSVFFAVAIAHPGLHESPVVYSGVPLTTVTVQEQGYAKVGAVIKSIPTAVSQQSHSVVHSSAHFVEDVVAPAVKTSSYTTRTLASPVVHTYHPAPAYVKTIATPVVQTFNAGPVIYKSW